MNKNPHKPILMKAAAKRPADSSHTSVVNKYMANAVKVLNRGARNTHTSRMLMGRPSACDSQWMAPDVNMSPG